MKMQSEQAAGMKILVVDDALDIKIYLGALLRKWGFQVVFANDGVEARELLEKEVIKLVISDWVMPHMSGVELCR